MRKIASGHSSFGVVTDGGDVYVWGDASNLGIFYGERHCGKVFKKLSKNKIFRKFVSEKKLKFR